jgi:5'-phosphate synthase pdxT subunit
MKIGVLGLQGAVREHLQSLARLGIKGSVVKRTSELADLSGIILPGEESTAISLLAAGSLLEELRRLIREGFLFSGPVRG